MRLLKRFSIILLFCLGCYLALVLVGLIPINNDFKQTPEGVTIYLISNPIHSDIVMPMKHEIIHWREHFPAECFAGPTGQATRIAIGWGDQGFYINTPRWSDFRVSTALHALLWPSKTCMHVTCLHENTLPVEAVPVTISTAQYAELVAYILSSFQEKSGVFFQIEDAAYNSYDAFFEARGSYNCFNTCNCWTGRALQQAGVQVGWFTPLPKTPLLYLPHSATKP